MDVFNIAFLEHFKVLIVGILIYAIVFALLRKMAILGEDAKVNSLIAFITAIIVSFSGVVTYAVSYAITWFVVILFVVFLLLIILMFLGFDLQKDITDKVKDHGKTIAIIFLVLFVVIFVKSFFALNNTFDSSNPQNNSYAINTQMNTGVNDMVGEGDDSSFFSNIDPDLLSAVIFLIAVGIFVIVIGR